MALFKPFRGNRASLDAKEMHDGYAYFCVDDGTFHIDYVDDDGNLQRKQINADEAQKLVGYDISTALNSSDFEIPTSKAVLDTLDTQIVTLQKQIDDKVNKEGDSLINGSLSINGDLNVRGTTHTVNTETLTVNDNLIMVQGQNQAMTGIIADNGAKKYYIKAGTKLSLNRDESIFTAMEKYLSKFPITGSDYMAGPAITIAIDYTLTRTFLEEEINEKLTELIYFPETKRLEASDVASSYAICYNVVGGLFYIWDEGTEAIMSFDKDIFISNELYNFFISAAVIKEGGFEQDFVSVAAPVLVGDTLKIGEGIAERDENGNITDFEFIYGAAQSIATRADNISHGAILSWDAYQNTIVEGTNIEHPLETAEGENSVKSMRPVEDNENFAFGADSMSIGKGAIATGDRAFALGRAVKSGGNASFVIGQNNIADNGRTEDVGKWNSALTDEEEKLSANVAFVGGRNNTARGDATFMFGVENIEAQKGNTNIVLGQSNKLDRQSQSTLIGVGNELGIGSYNTVIGYSNKIDEDSTAIVDSSMLLGFHLETKDSNKIVIGRLNKPLSENSFEIGDGVGTVKHNLIEGRSYIENEKFINSMKINAYGLTLNSSNINIPSSIGQEDWLQIKDPGNHMINIVANAAAGLSISNGSQPVYVVSGALDLFANKGITFRTHGATAPSLRITSGMDNTIETGERATFVANGKMRALKAPTAENDVVRLGDITKLLKVVEGLTDAQLDALNNFAKSLREGD